MSLSIPEVWLWARDADGVANKATAEKSMVFMEYFIEVIEDISLQSYD